MYCFVSLESNLYVRRAAVYSHWNEVDSKRKKEKYGVASVKYILTNMNQWTIYRMLCDKTSDIVVHLNEADGIRSGKRAFTIVKQISYTYLIRKQI